MQAKELQGSQAGCALYIAQTRADLLDAADERTLTPESSNASAVSVESRSPAEESPNVSPTALERLSPKRLEQRLKIPGQTRSSIICRISFPFNDCVSQYRLRARTSLEGGADSCLAA